METGLGIQLSMSSNIWSSAEVNKTRRKDQDFQISSTIIISYKNLWKTTISPQKISKSNSSCRKQVIHFLTAGFSTKISLKPQFSRNKHFLEDGVQCSHSGKSHLFPNHWSVLSLAVALEIGWQILTQAGLPKQVINIFLFHFSDPDKVWVQHRPRLHCPGKDFVSRSTRFPWRARLKLLWDPSCHLSGTKWHLFFSATWYNFGQLKRHVPFFHWQLHICTVLQVPLRIPDESLPRTLSGYKYELSETAMVMQPTHQRHMIQAGERLGIQQKIKHHSSPDFLHVSCKIIRNYFTSTYTMLRDACLDRLQRSADIYSSSSQWEQPGCSEFNSLALILREIWSSHPLLLLQSDWCTSAVAEGEIWKKITNLFRRAHHGVFYV